MTYPPVPPHGQGDSDENLPAPYAPPGGTPRQPPLTPYNPPSGGDDEPTVAPAQNPYGPPVPPSGASGFPTAPPPSGYEVNQPGAPVYGTPPSSPYGQAAPYGQAPTGGYGGPPVAPGGYGAPYGAPPTGQYPGGYYGGPQPTNGLAIGAFITSLTGLLFCLPGVVGLILGIIALQQVNRTGAKGRGFAVAGIIIGAVATVVGVVLFTSGFLGAMNDFS